MTAVDNTQNTAKVDETKEAQVICASVSFFERRAVLDPVGDVQKNAANEPVYSTTRKRGRMGEIIEVSPAEFNRLLDLGAVREPSDEPLGPKVPVATPFGVPVPNEDGDLQHYPGLVMGDPRPTGDASDVELTSGRPRALTIEEARALQARADGLEDDEDDDEDEDESEDDSLYATYLALDKDELEKEAASRELTVTRADGGSGKPRKEDYARALAEADEKEED